MPFDGERLKAERERLGLGQAELAGICAVTPRSQRNYEGGERMPDAAYLALAVGAGVDVMYVLTGNRALTPDLSADEQELLALYKSASLAGKAAAIGALQGVAATAKSNQAPKRQKVRDNHGFLVMSGNVTTDKRRGKK